MYIEKSFLYRLLSYVPFTEPYKIENSLISVRNHLDEKKAQILDLARKNTNDSSKPFILNDSGQGLFDRSRQNPDNKRGLPPNQTLLFYALSESETGLIGDSATDFLNSRGPLLLPFVIEFDDKTGIATVFSINYHKSLKAKDFGSFPVSHFERYANDIFNSLVYKPAKKGDKIA